MSNFVNYIARGFTTEEFLSQFSTPQAAAEYMYDYITGEAADETAVYDTEAANEMRETEYSNVLSWIQNNWASRR